MSPGQYENIIQFLHLNNSSSVIVVCEQEQIKKTCGDELNQSKIPYRLDENHASKQVLSPCAQGMVNISNEVTKKPTKSQQSDIH